MPLLAELFALCVTITIKISLLWSCLQEPARLSLRTPIHEANTTPSTESEARQGTDLEAETQLVRSLGISKKDTLIEYGSGTCAFVEAAAKICRQVHAADVSLAMIEFARQRLGKLGLNNVAFHHAGFLTYEHRDEPASFVITKFALHHLPDF